MARRASTVSALDMPTRRAVRLVALRLLAAATNAALRVKADPANPAALHEFRTASRRLRSWLKSWRPVLQGRVRRRDERRLRRIAGATGPARDLDVQLKWIDARPAPPDMSEPLAKARASLEARREAARAAVEAAAAELASHEHRLQRRISVYREDVRVPEEPDDWFGHALGSKLRETADMLHERLDMVRSRDDAAEIHALRISAKRLRYLLEPVVPLVPRSAPLVKALKSLQDEAGTLHDVHVLREELSGATREDDGLSRLLHRLDAKTGKSFAALESNWLGDSAASFFARLLQVSASLARTPGEFGVLSARRPRPART